MGSKFEIFNVTYLTPRFGAEGEFNPQEWHMMISTQGGKEDARAACEQYHKGCKVINVTTQMEDIAGVKNCVPKKGKKK